DLGRSFVWAMTMSATVFAQSFGPEPLKTTQPFAHGGHRGGGSTGGRFNAVLACVFDKSQAMVVSVFHFTNQVEIGGGGHPRILSRARGPAPPPSAGPRAPHPQTNPIPSPASDLCISIPLGGYDDPFLC